MFEVHIHDLDGRERPPFPERGQSQEQVLQRLLDPPLWTDSVLVFTERTGRQVVVAFTDQARSDRELRVVLDLLVLPDHWRGPLAGSPHRLYDGGAAT